jgi:catalase
VRFSTFAGIPSVADNDPMGSSPQGMFARQAYFAITALKFTNADGQNRFGRFCLRPEAGSEFLTPEQAAKKTADFLAAELSERLAKGPVAFRVLVQLAEAGDDVTDSTSLWPEARPGAEFGTLAIRERVDELAPEQRKIIFDPAPRVDGIDSAGDPLTDVRSEIYLLSGRRRRAAAAE